VRKSVIWIIVLGTWLMSPLAVFAEAPGINVAVIYALTGRAAISNRPSVLGTRLAAEEINDKGGVLGQKINLMILDNMSSPIGSSMAAQQAVEAGVTAIIGAAWSSHSLAIAEVAQKNHIPMISNFSTSPKLTRIGDYIFRVCFNDDFQGRVMAEFARKDLGAATAVTFVDLTSDYSLALSAIFRQYFERLGGKIISEIEYKANQESFLEQVEEARQFPADVVFFSGHDESAVIANQLQMIGVKTIPLGGDGWATKSFFEYGGNQLKQAYFCSHWSAVSDDAQAQFFVAKYGDHADFDVGTALAYDAVTILAAAIQKAGSSDPVQVRQALQELDAFQGVTGTIKFDEQGDPVKRAVIMEIRDGQAYSLKTFKPQ
jgi:branched-chain amino acid transport system substrate-binding protein